MAMHGNKKMILKEGKYLVVGYPTCEYRIMKHLLGIRLGKVVTGFG